MKLHEAMIEVLNRHGGGWMDRDLIAKEIASGSLFVPPSYGLTPPSDQLRLRARNKSYAQLRVQRPEVHEDPPGEPAIYPDHVHTAPTRHATRVGG